MYSQWHRWRSLRVTYIIRMPYSVPSNICRYSSYYTKACKATRSQPGTHISRKAIAAQSLRKARGSRCREVNEVSAKLDVFALTFSDVDAPYQYTLEDLFETRPELHRSPFTDIRHVHTLLIDLLRWMLVLGNHIYFGGLSADSDEMVSP